MGMFAHAAGNLPTMQKAFFRNSVAAVFSFMLLVKDNRAGGTAFRIPKGCFKYVFLRSFCGSFGIFGNFYALDHLPISDASMLNKMSPFFSILGSFIFLGEKIEPVPLLAVITAFAGALMVIKPSLNFASSFPGIAGFAGGMGAGFAYAFVRKCSGYKINKNMIIFFFSVFSCLISLPFMVIGFEPMTFKQLALLIGAGLAASGGQFGITNAYFNAPAGKISIYEYSMIIFSAILGFIAFRQVPDMWSFIGYGIIITVAAVIFLYNQKKMKTKVKFS